MQMLNRYFTPFALILILSAIHYYEPESGGASLLQIRQLPRDIQLSLALLAVSVLVNWWLASNTYRFVGWTRQLKAISVWMNFVWSVPLVYWLIPYWGPMWLLFLMAPVTAALYLSRGPTLGVALVSAGSLMGIYWIKGLAPEGAAFGMACVHACFIVIFALFVHGLAQAALRLRDSTAA